MAEEPAEPRRDIDPSWWRDVQADEPGRKLQLSSLRLRAAADQASDPFAKEILQILWITTSAMLDPDDWNAPYKPLVQMEGQRSPIPSDLSAEQLELLRRVVDSLDETDEPSFRARIYDACWTFGNRGDVDILDRAIEAYMSVPLSPESWLADGLKEWSRGLELARRRRKTEVRYLQRMGTSLVSRLQACTLEDGFFGVELSRHIGNYALAKKEAFEDLGELSEQLAESARTAGNRHLERAWEKEASVWFAKAGLEERGLDAQVRLAESFEAEAADRRAAAGGQEMSAAHFVEQSIKILRTLPRRYRSKRELDQRIETLRGQLRGDRERILEGMISFESDPLDITDYMRTARQQVQGRTDIEALAALGWIHPLESPSKALSNASDMMQESPLLGLLPNETISTDGRKVATRAGGTPGTNSADAGPDADPAIWSSAIQHHLTRIGLVCQGMILPALDTVTLEHRYQVASLYELCRDNPLIPHRHELTWAHGLWLGLNSDFISATCVLIPQLEHFVRYQLKRADVYTLFVDEDGVETEKGLKPLLDDARADEVLTPELSFEFKALLTDSNGPDLRNAIAHGLAADGDLLSTPALYAWWLALRIATMPVARSLAERGSAEAESAENEGRGRGLVEVGWQSGGSAGSSLVVG